MFTLHSSYCSHGWISQKKMDMLARAPVEYLYLEIFAKTFIMPARQNQFILENFSNKAPIRRFAIATNTSSAFFGSFTENPLWYQALDLRQVRTLRGGQPIVDFDTADNVVYMWLPWKQWTFRLIFPQFPLRISKSTNCCCLTSLHCKTLLKIVIILNLLEKDWDWS